MQVVGKTASSDQEADVFILQAWAGHTPFCAQDPLFIKQGLEGSLQDFFQDSKVPRSASTSHYLYSGLCLLLVNMHFTEKTPIEH